MFNMEHRYRKAELAFYKKYTFPSRKRTGHYDPAGGATKMARMDYNNPQLQQQYAQYAAYYQGYGWPGYGYSTNSV